MRHLGISEKLSLSVKFGLHADKVLNSNHGQIGDLKIFEEI